jgi:hypothetical protein
LTTPALRSCALCDGGDTLGVGLCPGCLATVAGERTLLFVREATIGDPIERVLNPVSDLPATLAALRTGRPLLAVPAAVAPRVLAALEEHGFAARGVPARSAWRAMPRHFYVMLSCMVLAGAVAGGSAERAFLWASPVFAAALLLLGHLYVRRPVLVPDDATLPGGLQADVAATLLGLAPGSARDRLIELLRIARPLSAGIAGQGDPARVRDSIHDLIRAACDTARETDRLTRTADVIRSSLVWTPEVAGEEQAESARKALQRSNALAARGLAGLAEAVAALGRVDTETAALDGPVGAELAELTRGLEAAARVHIETFRELNELLA